MKKLRRALLLLALVGIGRGFAQESPAKIVFLHLKWESNQVSVVSTTIVPGKLKRFSERHPGLDLEVANAAGQVLWTNNVADPTVRRLEYEDPDHPGAILNKEIQTTNAEFVVRVPAFHDAARVNFYLPPSSAGTNVAHSKASATNAPPERTQVGSVELPQDMK